MLKACIIYIPGCGGSFLRRILSLSENSIVSDPLKQISCKEKFELFNNWNDQNWKLGEDLHKPNYRYGIKDFFEFEQSNLFLIDAWHPQEFLNHEQNQTCWIKNTWPKLIVIDVNDSFKTFVEINQSTKHYEANWDQEKSAIDQIKTNFNEKILTINFESFLNQKMFVQEIELINSKLSLDLNFDLVEKLWQGWYSKSTKVWNRPNE